MCGWPPLPRRVQVSRRRRGAAGPASGTAITGSSFGTRTSRGLRQTPIPAATIAATADQSMASCATFGVKPAAAQAAALIYWWSHVPGDGRIHGS
jgi:hypothetical protein